MFYRCTTLGDCVLCWVPSSSEACCPWSADPDLVVEGSFVNGSSRSASSLTNFGSCLSLIVFERLDCSVSVFVLNLGQELFESSS
jgi:hypothetical protein